MSISVLLTSFFAFLLYRLDLALEEDKQPFPWGNECDALILASATLLCTLEAAQAQIFHAAIFPGALDPRSARHIS